MGWMLFFLSLALFLFYHFTGIESGTPSTEMQSYEVTQHPR